MTPPLFDVPTFFLRNVLRLRVSNKFDLTFFTVIQNTVAFPYLFSRLI